MNKTVLLYYIMQSLRRSENSQEIICIQMIERNYHVLNEHQLPKKIDAKGLGIPFTIL